MKLRIGIAGAGRMGSLHADNVARTDRMQVVAVHDVNASRSASLASRHGARAASSLEELLSSVDAVVVSSATDTHPAVALAAARAGRAVYLEKPIDLNFATAVRTASALRDFPVPMMVGFNRRFDPAYRQLRDAIHDEVLGRLLVVQMTSRGPNETPTREYIAHSGGIYRDKTVHFFDLLRFLSGREAVEVQAMGATLCDPFIGEMGDVDTCVVQLRLDDGSFCQIDNSRRAVYGFDERVEVHGARGLREVGRARSSFVGADEGGVFGSAFPESFMYRFETAFRGAMDGFARCVLDDARDVPTVDDAIAAQAIAEAATQSAQERRPVSPQEALSRVGGYPLAGLQ